MVQSSKYLTLAMALAHWQCHCGLQVGVSAGGIADNVLPFTATITLNLRPLPGGWVPGCLGGGRWG